MPNQEIERARDLKEDTLPGKDGFPLVFHDIFVFVSNNFGDVLYLWPYN